MTRAIAIALYGSNEYSYSVGDLLTTVYSQCVPSVSVFTFYALDQEYIRKSCMYATPYPHHEQHFLK